MKADCFPEYEEEVLRFCIQQTEREEVHQALDDMTPEWFHTPMLRPLATAILTLWQSGRPITLPALKSFHEWQKDAWIVGGLYWNLLNGESSYSPWDIPDMVTTLRDAWRRRGLRARMNGLLDSLDTLTTAEIETGLQAAIDAGINTRLDNPPTMHEAWEKYQNGVGIIPKEQGENVLFWGIPALDNDLRTPVSSFGVVAAKTSAGKTSLAIQMAVKTADRGKRVHFISLEMSLEEVQSAMVSSYEGRQRTEVERGTGVQRTDRTPRWIQNITIDALPSGTPWGRIEQRIRRLWKQGLDAVVLDYFSLLEPPDSASGRKRELNSAQAFGEISKALRRLSQELKIAVVVVAQFNRMNEDGTEPSLNNLRETGQLEQDATWVVLMWTDLQSIKDAEADPRASRTIHARIAKNRGGRRWVRARVDFNPSTCQFHQLETRPFEPPHPKKKSI